MLPVCVTAVQKIAPEVEHPAVATEQRFACVRLRRRYEANHAAQMQDVWQGMVSSSAQDRRQLPNLRLGFGGS